MNNIDQLIEDLEQLRKRTVGEAEERLIERAITTLRVAEAEINKLKMVVN